MKNKLKIISIKTNKDNMKTNIQNTIDQIKSQIDYIENNEDYANGYEFCIGDTLTYSGTEHVQTWLESRLDTKLDKYEVEELESDLCSNGNHVLVFKGGYFNYDEKTDLLSWPIGEIQEQSEYLESVCKSPFFPAIREHIERETDCHICKDGEIYLNYSDSAIYFQPNIEDLKEVLENYRINEKTA